MGNNPGRELGKLRDLYVSKQIHVTARIYDEAAPVVIAFASGGRPRELTGAAMFEKYRINAVFFSCVEIDWFQYSDLTLAENAIRTFVEPFPRRIAYGFSMGGYGALLSSMAIGADVVMACSPQAAMGPGLPEGEQRWSDERARIANELGYPNDRMAERISRTAQIYVLYDPLDFDRYHTAMIRSYRPIVEIFFPLSGHNTLPLLASMGMASSMVRALVEDGFDPISFQSDLHRRRRSGGRIELLIAEMQRRNRTVPLTFISRLLDGSGKIHLNRLTMAFRIAAEAKDAKLLSQIVLRLVEDNVHITRPRFLQDLMAEAALLTKGDPNAIVGRMLLKASSHPKARAVPLLAGAAALLHAAGNAEAALKYARRAGELVTPWDTENTAVADIFRFIGRAEESDMFRRRTTRLKEPTFSSYEQRARPFERAEDFEPAIVIWRQAASDGVEPLRVAVRLAKALMKARREAEAIIALEPSLARALVSVETRKLEGILAARLGMKKRAVQAYGEAVHADPNDASSQRGLSNAFAACGDLRLAVEHADHAFRLNPNAGNEKHLFKLKTQICDLQGTSA